MTEATVYNPGTEAQDTLHFINTRKEEGETAMNNIERLTVEVETYRQAIQDAKDALASAEQELEEVLAYEYENQ